MRSKPSLNHTTIPCIIFLIFGLIFNSFSQTDSLYVGKGCKLVFYNGTSAEGTISRRTNDTITLKTEYVQHNIAVKDIKFVLRYNEDIPTDEADYQSDTSTAHLEVLSEECDVYLDDRSVLKGVTLTGHTDSTFTALKEPGRREVPYSMVRKIVFKPVSPFGTGFLVGAGAGFLIGFIPFALAAGEFEWAGVGVLVGLACSIPAGLVGGVIGLLSAKDEVFLFDKGGSPVKIKRINYIIINHPDK